MLEKVRYSDYDNGIGVEAFTDGYAYDEYNCLYLLSVAGRDANVKAITSALVSGRTIEINPADPIELGASFSRKYHILGTKLPNTLLHQVVLDDAFFQSPGGRKELLYADGREDITAFVYEAVRNGCPVPVIPEWSGWLYEKLKQEDCLQELYGTKKVLKLNLSEEHLDGLISEGVKNGEISF